MARRRINVEGVFQETLDEDKLAIALWLMGKAAVKLEREREAEERKRRETAGGDRDER